MECAFCGHVFYFKQNLVRHLKNCKGPKIKRFPRGPPYKCSLCGNEFTLSHNLAKHQKKCEGPKKQICLIGPPFDCNLCHHSFSFKQNLVKHKKICKGPKVTKFRAGPPYECAHCGKSYGRRQNLVRHMHLHLPGVTYARKRVFIEKYECALCGRKYNRRHNLVRHFRLRGCTLPKIGSSNLPVKIQCKECFKIFRVKNSLKRHIAKVHEKPIDSITTPPNDCLRCVLCGADFWRTDEVLQHIISAHDVPLVHEHLRFASVDEFNEWKSQMQKNTTSVFVKIRYHQSEKANVSWFKCHRSGAYKPRVTNRHRRIKLQGSMKIGGFCPATITASVCPKTGRCRVSYVRTHLGHNVCAETELAHMYLSDDEKNKLAVRISAGVPYNRILTEHNSYPIREKSVLDPVCLLNKQSLNNISATFRVKPPLETETQLEPYSVEMFVAEYRQSILFFKRAGEPHPTETYLNAEDVVVVVMTQVQEELLRRFGHNVVSADGTFGANDHRFVLHTLAVFDEWYEGVPVAVAVSNRNDAVFSDLFLRVVRDRAGRIAAKTFISEMQTTYYESWRRVMGDAKFELYCKWHVEDAWRKHARKVSDVEKRTTLLRDLNALSTCLDENRFHAGLRSLLTNMDLDLQSFLRYFENNFADNVRAWAHCYRANAGINTNFHLKAFDRCMKYFSGSFLQRATFADFLSLLNEFLELETKELRRKRIFGKLSTKLGQLRRRHDEVIKNGLSITVDNVDDPFVGWLVSIGDENDESSILCAIRPKVMDCVGCKLYCEECECCLHAYECTCCDHCIEFNMCVHIHALCQHLKRNDGGHTPSTVHQPPQIDKWSRSPVYDEVNTNDVAPLSDELECENELIYENNVKCENELQTELNGVNDANVLPYEEEASVLNDESKCELKIAEDASEIANNEVQPMQTSFIELCKRIRNVEDVKLVKRISKTTDAEFDALNVTFG